MLFCGKVSCGYLMLGKEMITSIILWIIFAVLVVISVQLSNVTKLLRSIDAQNSAPPPIIMAGLFIAESPG